MRRIALFLLLIVGVAAFAQQPANSRAELERRRQSILESIRESQDELAATKKNKNATMAQLRALQSKLDARLNLIANINEEISSISGTIKSSAQEVGQLRESLSGLKLRYAQSLRYAYANRSSYNMLAFLFSAENYNDAVRRMKYLKRYRDLRKQQSEAIRNTQERIEHKIDYLNVQKNEKDKLLTTQEQQRLTLQQETNEKGAVVKELKGREKELIANIEKNKKANRQVERAVNAIIAREIEAQRRKAADEERRRVEEEKRMASRVNANNNGRITVNNNAGTHPSNNANTNPGATATIANPRVHHAPTTARELSMTPEAIALSNSFAANKGRLPWPVDRGTITSNFGLHQHAVAKVTVENLGIDIQTSPGATVRAVFDGTVTSVFPIPGAGVCVCITHGDYFTVYTNLASASVHKGDPVRTKQGIGTVGINDEGLPVVNFQVWKSGRGGTTKMNPAGWIAN